MLEGVRQDRWRLRPDEARRLDEALAARGQVAYRVVSPDGAFGANRARERRAGAREPMRLRSAKVLDRAFQFVCERRICDRSLDGLKLALARDVPLPRRRNASSRRAIAASRRPSLHRRQAAA
jgi:hypothetical protein